MQLRLASCQVVDTCEQVSLRFDVVAMYRDPTWINHYPLNIIEKGNRVRAPRRRRTPDSVFKLYVEFVVVREGEAYFPK